MSKEESTVEDLYKLHKSGGFNVPDERNDLSDKNIKYHGGVTGYKPIQDNDDDGLGVDLITEIKWLRNANIVNLQEKKDLHEKIKNYKKFIKMLLEDL